MKFSKLLVLAVFLSLSAHAEMIEDYTGTSPSVRATSSTGSQTECIKVAAEAYAKALCPDGNRDCLAREAAKANVSTGNASAVLVE